MATLLSPLYWSLPGPKGFVMRVEQRARACRATVLSFPRNPVAGTREGVKEGLRCAGIRHVVDLTIREGTDIAYEIGPHVRQDFTTPARLAELTLPESTAILLNAASPGARRNCEDYFARFLLALEHAQGNVHLFIEMQDGEPNRDSYGQDVQVIAFDGALSADEMAAYVGIRMLGRDGLGTTKLFRALVTEYAGFDVSLAERLIRFSDSDILGLPDTLGALIEEDPLRWRTKPWAAGRQAAEPDEPRHPLHEWYLALHAGPAQGASRAAATRRYWRACVRALTPWLEERRARVLGFLRQAIDAAAVPYQGRLPKPGAKGSTLYLDLEELDYNNIVGLAHSGILCVPRDPLSQQAFAVCKSAKKVRDDIAHLRAPKLNELSTLVASMDALLPD